MTYYDTTHTSERDRSKFTEMAHSQDMEVLQQFYSVKGPMTPSEVHDILYRGSNVPLTSVRRSITNLTNQGRLKKLNDKKLGQFGRPEHCWVYIHD